MGYWHTGIASVHVVDLKTRGQNESFIVKRSKTTLGQNEESSGHCSNACPPKKLGMYNQEIGCLSKFK